MQGLCTLPSPGLFRFPAPSAVRVVPIALLVLGRGDLNKDKLGGDPFHGRPVPVARHDLRFVNRRHLHQRVANSPWLPLILGSFSLAGIFAGIVFRVRGMLLLGSIFLLLSIVTMIWYASENFGWTWLWYVFGIATGATIIFMFAVFEKKRTEMLRVVEGLKDWDR